VEVLEVRSAQIKVGGLQINTFGGIVWVGLRSVCDIVRQQGAACDIEALAWSFAVFKTRCLRRRGYETNTNVNVAH